MFIGLYCCFLVRVQSLSLVWADLHHTDNLWVLFQGLIVEFQLDYPIFYLGTSKFSPKHFGDSTGEPTIVKVYRALEIA